MYTRRKFPTRLFVKAIRQLASLVLLAALGYLLYIEGTAYLASANLLPTGAVIAGIDVSGLSREEAKQKLESTYTKPITAIYNEQGIEIDPLDAEFEIFTDSMLDKAFEELDSTSDTERFVYQLANHYLPEGIRPEAVQIEIPLEAHHSRDASLYLVNLLSSLIDRPAQAPTLLTGQGAVEPGKPGYVINQEKTLSVIEAALYQPYERQIELAVEVEEAPNLDFTFLEASLNRQLQGFDGVGVLYILDLQTGEEININGDKAISGLSVVKIAIMLETLRSINGPLGFDEQKLLEETAIFSGNYSANLLLDIIAGVDNAYLGVDLLTGSMQKLGLQNTYIVTPYEEIPRAGKQSLRTPANQRPETSLNPDPAMQTTGKEIGSLLAMIYECANNKGTLIAVYPNELSPEECRYLIDLMAQNTEGNLIRFGVPEDVPVAHKHGWAYNTHGDAGIVFSPGGDYVIAQFLFQDSDWLPYNISFPLLRELSRSVYNFYNPGAPYMDHKRAQRVAGRYAAEQAVQP